MDSRHPSTRPGVNKKEFIFEYWFSSQKSYLNMVCFEKIIIFAYLKFDIRIPSKFSDISLFF